MEPTDTYLIVGGTFLAIILIALVVRFFKRGKTYKLTKPGLVAHAVDTSNALSDFAIGRETGSRVSEAVLIEGGEELQEHPDLYTDPYNEGTRVIYHRDYLPEIKVLRKEFAKRGLREKTLDRVYGNPNSVADVRTVSTALLVMAQRLR